MALRHATTRSGGAGRPGLKARVAAAAVALLAGTPAGLAQLDLSALLPGGKGPTEQGGDDAAMRNPLGDPDGGIADGVAVDENLMVDLHVQDEDLAAVLQMLSIQSQKSILTSKNVSATVTANLYDVTFYEALDAILHVNGYGYVERGNFIYVYTVEELKEIEEANRPRVSKVVKLNYLNAVDGAEFVRALLSEGGEIKTNGKTEAFTLPDNAPTGSDEFASDATLVIFDYEENVAQIEALLVALDTKPSQVLVEATILETRLTEENAFGVDFTILGSLDLDDFVALNPVDGLIGGQGKRLVGGSATNVPVPGDGYGSAVTSRVGNTGDAASLKVGIVSGDVAAFLRVLDEVSDTTVISKPNVLTLNRQPARVLVGTKVGYLSTTSTETSTTQTVEFLDTGTQLYFRPFVSADGMIRMELKPQVSNAVIRDVTDATGAVVTIPDENTSELTANVMIRDGQTVVLGGLFTERTTKARRQVPFAGDLPIVGPVFRGHDDSIDRAEIIFMITPSIVNDQVLTDQGRRGAEYIAHARAGAREGLLPWSREKQSAQLLVDARAKAAEGKKEAALHLVRRALALHQNQPDAIALRDELAGHPAQWPTRRLMEELTGEADARSGMLYPAPVHAAPFHAAPDHGTVASAHPDAQNTGAANPGSLGQPAASTTPEPGANDHVVVTVEPADQPDQWAGNEPSDTLNNQPTDPAGNLDAAAQANTTNFDNPDFDNPDANQPVDQVASQNGNFVAGQNSPANVRPMVEVNPDRTVNVRARGADLRAMLDMLAVQAGRNIVVSPAVSATVTASFRNAEFYDAIDTLVLANGLAYVERAGSVYVYTSQELAELAQNPSSFQPGATARQDPTDPSAPLEENSHTAPEYALSGSPESNQAANQPESQPAIQPENIAFSDPAPAFQSAGASPTEPTPANAEPNHEITGHPWFNRQPSTGLNDAMAQNQTATQNDPTAEEFQSTAQNVNDPALNGQNFNNTPAADPNAATNPFDTEFARNFDSQNFDPMTDEQAAEAFEVALAEVVWKPAVSPASFGRPVRRSAFEGLNDARFDAWAVPATSGSSP